MDGISILIPEYNDDCVQQVKALCAQCITLGRGIEWEIIVADDGTPENSRNNNAEIACIVGCKFILRGKNYGRASTRNFLARKAKYNTLLYIDSGLMPNPHLVENYVDNIGKSLVVCGNIAVAPECIDMTNLRCRNELKAQKRFTADKHSREPYKNFHSGNFMINRQALLANPFREDIKTYGYEDTLFGKQLADKHISISHIDNPVLFTRFESNARFIEKTREGIQTLYTYRDELKNYSPLLHLVNNLKKFHLLWLIHIIYVCFGKLMMDNLKGSNPNLKIFNLYRVCLLSEKCYQ